MRQFAYLCVFFVSVGLVACGPEQSARDQETALNNQTYQKQQSLLDTITGDYVGTYSGGHGGNNAYSVRLVLRSFTYLVAVPGRVELEQIPELIGSLRGNADNTILSWDFNQGQYNESTHALSLMGPGKGNMLFSYFKGSVIGNSIEGELMSGDTTLQIKLTRDNSLPNQPK